MLSIGSTESSRICSISNNWRYCSVKKGICNAFEEFKLNSPSIDFDYSISNEKVWCFEGQKEDYRMTYHAVVSQTESNTIGKIFGYCDGRFVYFNEGRLRKITHPGFYRMETIGRYCYYEKVERSSGNTLLWGS